MNYYFCPGGHNNLLFLSRGSQWVTLSVQGVTTTYYFHPGVILVFYFCLGGHCGPLCMSREIWYSVICSSGKILKIVVQGVHPKNSIVQGVNMFCKDLSWTVHLCVGGGGGDIKWNSPIVDIKWNSSIVVFSLLQTPPHDRDTRWLELFRLLNTPSKGTNNGGVYYFW